MNLLNRIYWWLTEPIFNEGYKSGMMVGAYFEREAIIKALDEADSACSGWAEAVIRNMK